jgi:AraC-like DNA-binding protein
MRVGTTAHHIKGFRPSLQAMSLLGVSAETCLQGTGITEADLDNPESTCTWQQELSFLQNLRDLSSDPCLGLKLAKFYSLPTYGLIGYAMLSAPTFRHAMNIIESYVELTYTVCDFHLEVAGNIASLILRPKYPIPQPLRDMLMDRDMACCYVGFSETLGEVIPLVEVSLLHTGHKSHTEYTEFYNCPVTLNANCCRLSFDAQLLDKPLPMRNFQASGIFDQQCQLMLSRLSKQGSFIEEIRQKILAKPSHSFPDINSLSDQIHISVRTLRRRLSEEGTSYRAIVEDIRFDLAKDYLGQSRLSLDMISELLGYHDAASFSHAFKRWTKGVTPSSWRKNNIK